MDALAIWTFVIVAVGAVFAGIGAVYACLDYFAVKRQEHRAKEMPLARPVVKWDDDANAAMIVNHGSQDAHDVHIEFFNGLATTGTPKGTGRIGVEVLQAEKGNRERIISKFLDEYSDATEDVRKRGNTPRAFRAELNCVISCRTPLGNPQQYIHSFVIPRPRPSS